MAVWPFLWGLCLICMAWAKYQDDDDVFHALLITFMTYVVTRLIVLSAPQERLDIPLALVWIGAAHLIRGSTDLRVFPYCLASMGLWYFIAYILSAPRVIWSWPYTLIDLIAFGAILWAAFNAGSSGGNRILDSDLDRGLGVSGHWDQKLEKAQTSRLSGGRKP